MAKYRPEQRKRKAASQPTVFYGLQSIRDADTRNLVRGALANASPTNPSKAAIDAIRKHADLDDLAAATAVVIGKTGAFPFSNTKRMYRDLLWGHDLDAVEPIREISFIAGHLNGWRDETLEVLGALGTLAPLPTVSATDALGALNVFAERWGASNLLAKKVAYVVATSDGHDQADVDKIAATVGQTSHSLPHFAALEAIDLGFPYFSSVASRIQMAGRYVKDGDFRQLLPLHNIVGSPLNEVDAAAFLRKAHSMSLPDEVCGVLQLFHLSERYPQLVAALHRQLDPALVGAILKFQAINFPTEALFSEVDARLADEGYYRHSAAFLEFREPAIYRDFVDQVVGPRLLKLIAPSAARTAPLAQINRTDLVKALFGFRKESDYRTSQNVGVFLRTVAFLTFLENPIAAAALTHHHIRFIFEHTTSLEFLMYEDELERLYAAVDANSRPLVSVLALALYKARSDSDDVDFKFRLNLSQTITDHFEGAIENFISWLVRDTPQVANFLLYTLDRPTLQKLYWLVPTADAADQVRQRILRIVGKVLKKIEYFVEADDIEAQRQVSRLRRYFDDSRIYVDGIAFKRWLIENPSSYSQQYARIIDKVAEAIPASLVILQTDGTRTVTQTELPAVAAHDYILRELASIVFSEFCININFGVESYLGRRIRHNTLSGMMRGGVEALIEKNQYRQIGLESEFRHAFEKWKDGYRLLIEQIRGDYLQFRSATKPKGLFSAELKTGEPTQTNIGLLRHAAWSARGNQELFNELLIRFCWREIGPQLEHAAKTIADDFFMRASGLIEALLGGFGGEAHNLFKAELRATVLERFSRLASWFRQPESGFVPASTRVLGDLIAAEASEAGTERELLWLGDATDLLIDGFSVHRMYDCLSVLIRNAATYGDGSPIEVQVLSVATPTANIARLKVTVISGLPEARRREHVNRLAAAFAEGDLNAAMVREGYSGIKKLRFINAQSEGTPTVTYAIDRGNCEISFLITVELAGVSDAAEERLVS